MAGLSKPSPIEADEARVLFASHFATLSDEFLAEIQQMEEKNLALEALRSC